GGEPPELRVRRQAAAELDLPPGRRPTRAAEAGAPAPGLRRRLRQLPREAGSRGGKGIPRPRGHLAGPPAPPPPLLPEPRPGDGRVLPRRCASAPCRLAGVLVRLAPEPVDVGELIAAPAELLLALLQVPEVEEVPARQQSLLAEQREELLADQERPEARLRLV